MVDKRICLWCPKRDTRVEPGELPQEKHMMMAGIFCGAYVRNDIDSPRGCTFVLEQLLVSEDGKD